ncbi:hypothetical protein SCP_0406520 [Sparassis crispa]|uniref:Uncharacterized protein n=1 Tax=Sparassis crispa TaxID=139825 RepID=A0A401GJC4_9APHY|nr:hypothetical protein SCP_0406520 [Sparassis crispa]GBE82268.1 hypothetical protein SCP_0406520 [Sparassis crispa]
MPKHCATSSKKGLKVKKAHIMSEEPDPSDVPCDHHAHVEDILDEDDIAMGEGDDSDDVVLVENPKGVNLRAHSTKSSVMKSSRAKAAERKSETPKEELEHLRQDWKSVVYAFFKPEVSIESDLSGKCAHMFHCVNRGCRIKIVRWLNKGDKGSTDEMPNANDAHPAVEKFARLGSITSSFKCKGKGKVTYSNRQHSHTESRAEIVHWVAESLRSFTIIEDHGFQCLMKTGVAKMLQDYDGELNFAMDMWTLPNNKAIVVFTMHLQHKGVPLGVNLAIAFTNMVEEYNISIKMLGITVNNATSNNLMINELAELIESFQGQANRACCFDHIVNLMVKTLLCQFDVLKGKAEDALDDAECALIKLAEDLDMGEEDGHEEDAPDNIDRWKDEHLGLTPEEREVLDTSIWPVKLILMKPGVAAKNCKLHCMLLHQAPTSLVESA